MIRCLYAAIAVVTGDVRWRRGPRERYRWLRIKPIRDLDRPEPS